MTYGWAILAAIIAIGVLAYFGVFSPGKYVSGSAIVNAPFYVNAWNVKSSAGVKLELQNNGPESFTIQVVEVTNCGTNDTEMSVGSDVFKEVLIPCSPALTEGDNFKGDVTITYRKSGSTVDLTSTGTIAEKVTA